ncbi:HNH endonuclease signature motif containing protein [Marinovum sp. E06]|uniref:HNH endonuclease signature motif containing protein n=1 Tax=Marinovum sp. E06 TaxID=3449225 RepID=UPI003EDC2E3B
MAADFTCERPGCGRIEADTSKLVADHIDPHRGDPAKFWDRDNLQCLCKACHDSDKQKQERRGGGGKSLQPANNGNRQLPHLEIFFWWIGSLTCWAIRSRMGAGSRGGRDISRLSKMRVRSGPCWWPE